MLTWLSGEVLPGTADEWFCRRQRGCQASTGRSFPIHVGGQMCRFSNPGFRWWWQLWMHPVGSSTRPFLLISLSEGEFSRVSTTYIKMSLWGLLPALCSRFLLRGAKGESAFEGEKRRGGDGRVKQERKNNKAILAGCRPHVCSLLQLLLLIYMEEHICVSRPLNCIPSLQQCFQWTLLPACSSNGIQTIYFQSNPNFFSLADALGHLNVLVCQVWTVSHFCQIMFEKASWARVPLLCPLITVTQLKHLIERSSDKVAVRYKREKKGNNTLLRLSPFQFCHVSIEENACYYFSIWTERDVTL